MRATPDWATIASIPTARMPRWENRSYAASRIRSRAPAGLAMTRAYRASTSVSASGRNGAAQALCDSRLARLPDGDPADGAQGDRLQAGGSADRDASVRAARRGLRSQPPTGEDARRRAPGDA